LGYLIWDIVDLGAKKKDPGIPSMLPYREELLRDIETQKAKVSTDSPALLIHMNSLLIM
jgi:hypothetical protein